MEPYTVKKQSHTYSSDEDYMMYRDQGETKQQYDWRKMLDARAEQGSNVWNMGVHKEKAHDYPHGMMAGDHGSKGMSYGESMAKMEEMYKMHGKDGESKEAYMDREMKMGMYKSVKKIVVPVENQVV